MLPGLVKSIEKKYISLFIALFCSLISFLSNTSYLKHFNIYTKT